MIWPLCSIAGIQKYIQKGLQNQDVSCTYLRCLKKLVVGSDFLPRSAVSLDTSPNGET